MTTRRRARLDDGGAPALPRRHGAAQGQAPQGHRLHRPRGRRVRARQDPHEQGVRKNLKVRLGDVVSVHQCPDVAWRRPHPSIDDTIEASPATFRRLPQAVLYGGYAVRKNDLFSAGGMRAVEFKVVETDPDEYCIVAPTRMRLTALPSCFLPLRPPPPRRRASPSHACTVTHRHVSPPPPSCLPDPLRG